MEKIDIQHAEKIKELILRKSHSRMAGIVLQYVMWCMFSFFIMHPFIRDFLDLLCLGFMEGIKINPLTLLAFILPLIQSLVVIHCTMIVRAWLMGGWPWQVERREFNALHCAMMEGRTLAELQQDPLLRDYCWVLK